MKNKKNMKGLISVFGMALLMSVLMFTGCQLKREYTVSFNTCTNVKTNKVKDREVKAGEKVTKPNVYMTDDAYSNFLVAGWYTDEDYTTEWNFDKDVVEKAMVLYAKWENQFFVRYFTSATKEPRLGVYLMDGEKAEKQD